MPKASDYRLEIKAKGVTLTSTPSDILGPFYLPNAPLRTQLCPSPTLFVQGRILGQDGGLLHGVLVEIWQADEKGTYYNDPNNPTFRGNQHTGQLGTYALATIIPGDYKISDPGQSDDFRCAHIHFKLTCPGYKELVTQLYFHNDKYNATDHWFDPRRVIYPPSAVFDFVLEKE